MTTRRDSRRRDEGRGSGPGDRGQLLLLSGIILALAFLITALTLNQVANMESQVSREQRAIIIDEFSFLREEINTTLSDLVTSSTSNSTFNDTFDRMVFSIKSVERGHGYDLVVVKGAPGYATPATEEDNFTAEGKKYKGVSFDGHRNFTGEVYDGVNDGILWYDGEIKGVVVYIYISDEVASMEEVLLFPVNA